MWCRRDEFGEGSADVFLQLVLVETPYADVGGAGAGGWVGRAACDVY